MNYVITGGAGFIGSHLAKLLLKENHQITILDDLSTGSIKNLPQDVNFIEGNILDDSALAKAFEGVDGCFHLAAVASVQRSIDNWEYCHKVNLTGTINIFLKAAELGIPVVYTSSAAVYGAASNLPLQEDEPIHPLSPYAVDKYACELQAKVFGGVKSLKSCGLRLFNVYGEGQLKGSDYSGVISIFRQLTEEGSRLTIFGDGEQSRDFIHVSDVARAFSLAMKAASIDAPVINICTGVSISINDLAGIISQITEVRGVSYLDAQAGSIKASLGGANLAQKLLGFKSSVLFKDGISQLFALL